MNVKEYYHYYKCPDESIIRIRASRKPSQHTKPIGDTWIVCEYNDSQWRMGCFPEITWGRLKKMTYIGKISLEE